jgi:RHS repeat-associated protein
MNGGIWHELRRAFGAYQYDAANRLTRVDGVGYTWDNNGNLLTTGLLTNTFDAANRLIETTRAGTTLQPRYDGLGNRVGQTVGLSTTTFALDVQGLPEVISTSTGNAYLHLPGVIVAENAAGERRFLLPDGLGSVRQAVDESGTVVVYNEFDPYGNPILNSSFLISNYGFTGEWWEDEVGLLYLRARWYWPETGSFLSRDPVEGEPAYLYVWGNPINYIDPSGRQCPGCPPEPGATATPGPQRPTPEPVPAPTPIRQGTPTPTPLPTPIDPLARARSVPALLNNANGYVEGKVSMFSAVGCVWTIVGEEIVYDFQSRQRQKFTYTHAPWDKRGYAPVPGLAFWDGSPRCENRRDI